MGRVHDPARFREFEATLAQIAALRDPASIRALLPFLDEGAKHDDLMFSLVRAIEGFEKEVYIREILSAVIDLWSSSPRWASVVFIRILTSGPSCAELMRQLPTVSSESGAVVRKILAALVATRPQFATKVTAVTGVIR